MVASDLEPTVAAPAAAVADDSAPAADSNSAVKSVTVRVPGNVPAGPLGGTLRTFSTADHGKDFKKAAEEYRVRYNGEYVK